ncbi:MAG: redoxin domain-containing protein, partial [Desulfobulbaceae bacterium]|nr:redoxin domain-containing protein [Desulfobulbaceae bacterium]
MNKFTGGLIAVLLLITSIAAMAAGNREDIHASADQVQPLLAGMKAPDFNVRDVEDNIFEFKAGQQDKPVVLTFFRGGWCPYCNL